MLPESLSFSNITAYLRDLCQAQRTGTLYIIDKGHLLARIGLKDGEIIYLFSQNTRDINGLTEILSKGGGRNNFTVSFTEGAIPSTRTDLPPTTEILAFLADFDSAATSPQSSGLPAALTAEHKAVLEQTLCEFIGPIATTICADCFPVAANLLDAIDKLADEIPTQQAATEFRAQVRHRLG